MKIILFDGVCNLCSASVRFTIEYDHKQEFKFASLQSDFAKRTLSERGINEDLLKTIVLIKNESIFLKSDAVLEICKGLNGLWPIFYSFKIIPRLIRDAVYDLISRNRYRWFGKKDKCWLPSPDLNGRFL